jgi:hypothetical protein
MNSFDGWSNGDDREKRKDDSNDSEKRLYVTESGSERRSPLVASITELTLKRADFSITPEGTKQDDRLPSCVNSILNVLSNGIE